MQKSDPQTMAKTAVREYIDKHLEKTDEKPTYQVYVVWFTYVLGSWKCLVSSTLPDGMYYEVTYSVVKNEMYLDAYKKFHNFLINIEG